MQIKQFITITITKGTWLCLHFKDNMITVTTVQLMKSHDQLNLTLNSRQLNFITWMLRFYRTGNYTFYKKINGQKLQKRMPRIGNHWPLVPWLHCTNLCHSRRRRTFWSYNPCLQSYRNLCRIPLSLNIPYVSLVVVPSFSASIWPLKHRSRPEKHDVSFLLTHSQFAVDSHW